METDNERLIQTCMEELKFIEDQLEQTPNEHLKRILYRGAFAGMEGLSAAHRGMAKDKIMREFARRGPHWWHAQLEKGGEPFFEVVALNEKGFEVNDKGEVKPNKAKVQTTRQILFSIRMAAKACGTGEFDPRMQAFWNEYNSSSEIRDRLTHPKGPADLDVSRKEIDCVLKAMKWLVNCYHIATTGESLHKGDSSDATSNSRIEEG